MKRYLLILVTILAVVALLPLTSSATVVTGSLNSGTGGGVDAVSGPSNPWDAGAFTIAWSINDTEPAIGGFKVWDYTYTVTVNQKTLSHLILQVSDNTNASDFFDLSSTFGLATGDPRLYSPSDPGNSNPHLPAAIFGLKLTPATTPIGSPLVYTINFDSFRSPVDGNFYANDGSYDVGSGRNKVTYDVTAWNTGLAGGTAFIEVPDTKTQVVPIPPSALLLGSGLLGLVGLGWRRKQD